MPGEDVKIETEIKTNDQGQKVEITRKIKIKKVLMTPAMLARRDWKKFGDCANLKKGPDSKSTTIGEAVFLDLSSNSKDLDKEEEEADAKAKMDQKSKIVCRNCKGDHWTPKCPYKNNLSEEKPESKGVAGIQFLTQKNLGNMSLLPNALVLHRHLQNQCKIISLFV